jgi:chromate transporter
VVLPSFLIILIIVRLFTGLTKSPWTKGIFTGIKPAVIGLIGLALWRVGSVTLTDYKAVLIFLGALVLLLKGRLHPIPVLILAGLSGLLLT